MTTRRSFLVKLLGLGGALLAANAVGSIDATIPQSESPTPPLDDHKIGYIAVGMPGIRPGDWIPFIDGRKVPIEHSVQSLSDVGGWYDCYTQPIETKHPTLTFDGTRFAVTRIYGNVSVIYTGNDPRYTRFKART